MQKKLTRMAMTAQRTKLSLLSKAADYAGLDLGEVVSEDERLAAEKQAEIEAIYGSSETADPNAGFAPAAYVEAPISRPAVKPLPKPLLFQMMR